MATFLRLLNEYIERGVQPEMLAAWAHAVFVQIHPYTDGNGHVARALTSQILEHHGLLPFVVRLSEKPEYIQAVDAANFGDLDKLVSFILAAQQRSIGLAADTPVKTDKAQTTASETDPTRPLFLALQSAIKAALASQPELPSYLPGVRAWQTGLDSPPRCLHVGYVEDPHLRVCLFEARPRQTGVGTFILVYVDQTRCLT